MRRIKHALTERKLPLGFTVMISFLAFSAVLISLLWLFQSVFLESFFQVIKISQVEAAASSIADTIGNPSKNDNDEIRRILSEHSEMSIMIFDTSNNVYARIYSSSNGATGYFGESDIKGHEVYKFYRSTAANGGTYTYIGNSDYKLSEDTPASDGGARYPVGRFDLGVSERKSVTYGQIVDQAPDGNEYFILIQTMVTPLAGTLVTLHIQRMLITIILIALSILLAFMISRMIAQPIVKVNRNAKKLAKQDYNVKFHGGAYREVQELNETLNYATSELSKVNKLRQELIANVSHDLRSPLTMIIGYSEIIRDLPGENTPENVQIIIDEATHLNALVSDLLNLSQLQSGTMKLELETFSITESVKNIFMRHAKLLGKRYKIFFEVDGNASIKADDMKISQVVYNLIINAANYVGEDKTIIVRQIADEKSVTIEVEDHGAGIDPDELDVIWERYYKSEKPHKTASIGTGLGLSIVRTVLDLHGALYGVRSRIGVGSVFWFTLPCVGFTPYPKGNLTLYLDRFGNIAPYAADCDEVTESSENSDAL